MAVFTAAAIAISVAVATTTMATVATAIVATSIAIGVAGLAVTAVGMITKNDGLLKAGQIMGYVGLAGGLAGGVVGGIGGMMEGGAGFLAGAKGAYTGAAGALSEAEGEYGSFFSASEGASVASGSPGAAGATGATPGAAPGLTSATPAAPGATSGLPAGTELSAGAPNVNGSLSSGNSLMGNVPEVKALTPLYAPTPPVPLTPGTIVPSTNSLYNTGSATVGNLTTVAGEAGKKAAESTIPDWVKLAGMTTAGQGLSGAAAGWFQGASAEQRIEFEKLINEQNRNQINYQNKNNQYAPLLSFAGGPAGPAGAPLLGRA